MKTLRLTSILQRWSSLQSLRSQSLHNNEDPEYTSDSLRDLNRAHCQIRAYCSLKRLKICDDGFAILIKYLPNPLPMNSNTYSKKCFEKVNISIQQIHLALILHNDPYSKNVLIVPGDPERVV
ncbi:uncharacterized protein BDCG_09075 [Blastomyces dermatitidis ER-3]|uniref:Protein kinase domain-containing protein n=1 Tax=Ajellomyces dermatitidis (strain ER-3 / ATCC MYA-2586) TaxID=559297 RepID=A0ABP2EQC8_AJEDR|nr:uncharacterized protein BDCG_09075 [Blastomyces dermatitidis ER-3]EEQ85806.2 hypothetical protein BDCG_09075 [Blastomyces dermatitidis ER-3]